MASTQPPPSYDGHKPKRDNQSVSSTSSRSGRSHSHPTVESAVTRLLVAIKQLLESLTLWSNLQMSESQISDVYVRLGNDFNAAVAAFASFNIDMSDLMSVPEDLREVLETCLSEDASPDTLNIYLPKVRQIITNLLHGLRNKQSMYRRIVSEHQSRQRSASHARTDSRSSKSNKDKVSSSKRDEEVMRHRSQLSRSNEEERNVETNRDSAAVRTSARPSSKRPEAHSRMTPPPFEEPDDDPPVSERPASTSTNGLRERTPRPSQPRHSQPTPQNAVYAPQDDVSARASTETLIASQAHTPPPSAQPPDLEKDVPPTPPPQFSPVPSSVKRYSLVDRPVSPPVASPPTVIVEPSSVAEDTHTGESSPSSPKTPPAEADAPGVASSLAALRSRDALERRASKRFSTYQFSRMAGNGLTRERTISNSSSRRSMAVSSNLTPGELAVLTEVDEPDTMSPAGSSKRISRTPSPASREPAPPVPPLPFPTGMVRAPSLLQTPSNRSKLSEEAEVPDSFQPASFPVFLQVGREVKKATFELGTSFSSLRMLFVDKFSYNPGMENFPAVYIRDPSSGVQYELEDMEEVKEKCLLSLNIEPLDQIKQHIDAQISTLSNDLKELKSAIAQNRRLSHHPSPIVAHEFVESTPIADRPSDKQFQHIARRLSRIVGDSQSPFVQPQMTGQSLQLQPQMTGASVMSEYSNRVVNDLKTQFDEVQNLRRDLGIMRQLYTEFMKSTKESLNTLRTQTQSVKQLASAKVGGARSFIDSGKSKLDTRSQNVLTKVEELQDTVEGLKDDVIKRQVTPKPQLLKNIQEDVASTAAELSSLKDHMDTIKPMWKKTWEEELQNIVEEQGFLSHQEELLADLLEDHKALADVVDHVQKVVNLRGNTPNRSTRGRFKALPADEGHGGLSTVMMEIRGAAVDPEKRLKAIAANQKNRERDLANRSDAFQNELTGFVSGKKLKMTGGTEEAERVRQKRNELALKAMFNNASNASATTANVPGGDGGGGPSLGQGQAGQQAPVLARPPSK